MDGWMDGGREGGREGGGEGGSSDRHGHAFCVTSSTGYELPTLTTGPTGSAWLVRVIPESFSGLGLKLGPINATRNTRICSPNRRNRAMHDRFSPTAVLSLPDPPRQRFIHVFLTCQHHLRLFSQRFSGFAHPTHDSYHHSGTGITYSYALFHLYFARGFCRVPLRRTHPGSIDGLSSRIC